MAKFVSNYDGGYPHDVCDYMLWKIHDDLMEQLNSANNCGVAYVDASFMMKLFEIQEEEDG